MSTHFFLPYYKEIYDEREPLISLTDVMSHTHDKVLIFPNSSKIEKRVDQIYKQR